MLNVFSSFISESASEYCFSSFFTQPILVCLCNVSFFSHFEFGRLFMTFIRLFQKRTISSSDKELSSKLILLSPIAATKSFLYFHTHSMFISLKKLWNRMRFSFASGSFCIRYSAGVISELISGKK